MIQVTMVTNFGNIQLELDDEKAPKTVENFLNYVRKCHYSETLFHRVIDGFMIQGGGFNYDMVQLHTEKPIVNEANNGLKNLTGTIAMARTNDPHSATCQFFINIKDNAFLDFKGESGAHWGYCVFGKVTNGMDVIDKIRAVKTKSHGFHQDVPVNPVIIHGITIDSGSKRAE